MKLTIFHDGQFFVGLVEYRTKNKVTFSKYIFGPEPDDETVLRFIENKLLVLVNQSRVKVKKKATVKRINPKRLQRKVAKEQKEKVMTTQSQQALKLEQELKKKEAKKKSKQRIEKEKERKRAIKKQKAKAKHKGH
ncbi:YjdF family protein [Staphylococcus auricularis]|uniref:DUF2992 domain-containing protein n=1 Tax=Staphylococcus auricularis TaxID=29379 RepID=A0ABX5IGV6_9STAP|nr:YjdF family protein [Staphylococcus auricularis]MCE5037611.1 YjdF family protein [Staphylococcus auricularis]MEB6569868.1 YjdF family protein [Staphylococcus auricularis]PTH19237.1 DUF2992 domain-containing protein [Staphylococcus auricularis]PTH26220.1 DUF2992 domain-containing protein [Staphylococcus auricularis]